MRTLFTHKKKEKISKRASTGMSEFEVDQQLNRVEEGSNRGMLSRKGIVDEKAEKKKLHAQISGDMQFGEALAAYSEAHSVVEPALLRELREEVEARYPPEVSRMLSGPSQGALLSFLVSTKKANNVLELGAFVGYSTLCLASDFGKWGHDTQSDEHCATMVHSCEIDTDALEIAKSYLQRSQVSNKVGINSYLFSIYMIIHFTRFPRLFSIISEQRS
ncbi:hypothetical protein EON65_09515 [archaeon]|nr:MAG: hypothetical protein EON65_09515 [archaeon]